jgi:hypothetical protein
LDWSSLGGNSPVILLPIKRGFSLRLRKLLDAFQ